MVEKDADLIFQNDPSAKIIQVIRNPVERIKESIESSSRRIISLGIATSLWRESSRYAQKNFEKYPENYLIVKWEDLLANVDQTLETICTFLGEAYSLDMIQPEAFTHKGFVVADQSKPGHRRLKLINTAPLKSLNKSYNAYMQARRRAQTAAGGEPRDRLV